MKKAQLSLEMLLLLAAYFAALGMLASFETGLARQANAKAEYFSDRIAAENLCFFADEYALDGLHTISREFSVDGVRYQATGREIRVAGSQNTANATCLADVQTKNRFEIEQALEDVR